MVVYLAMLRRYFCAPVACLLMLAALSAKEPEDWKQGKLINVDIGSYSRTFGVNGADQHPAPQGFHVLDRRRRQGLSGRGSRTAQRQGNPCRCERTRRLPA